jgi:hypothetical protein
MSNTISHAQRQLRQVVLRPGSDQGGGAEPRAGLSGRGAERVGLYLPQAGLPVQRGAGRRARLALGPHTDQSAGGQSPIVMEGWRIVSLFTNTHQHTPSHTITHTHTPTHQHTPTHTNAPTHHQHINTHQHTPLHKHTTNTHHHTPTHANTHTHPHTPSHTNTHQHTPTHTNTHQHTN